MKRKKYVYWQDGDTWLGYLEEYSDYQTQGESLEELIAGFTNFGKPIHIVCGKADDVELAIITVYIPSPPKFKNPYERG